MYQRAEFLSKYPKGTNDNKIVISEGGGIRLGQWRIQTIRASRGWNAARGRRNIKRAHDKVRIVWTGTRPRH